MPGIADTVAAAAPIVGTAIGGPVGGLVGSLAGAIVQMFSANAQKKIDAELARHGNSPDVVASINDTLSAGVMGLATQITGKTDPVEAYTAVVKDPAIVTQIEQATVAKLEEIAPFLDKIAGYEQQAFDRGEASMNAAVARQNSSPENRQLALLTGRITAWGLVGVTGVLLAMCVVQLWFAKTIDGTVATLAGGALAVLYQNAGQVFNFLFGQPQESRAASLAQAELDARRPRAQ